MRHVFSFLFPSTLARVVFFCFLLLQISLSFIPIEVMEMALGWLQLLNLIPSVSALARLSVKSCAVIELLHNGNRRISCLFCWIICLQPFLLIFQ